MKEAPASPAGGPEALLGRIADEFKRRKRKGEEWGDQVMIYFCNCLLDFRTYIVATDPSLLTGGGLVLLVKINL